MSSKCVCSRDLLQQLSSPSAMVSTERCPCTGGPGVSLGLPGEQLSHCLDPLPRLPPLRLPSAERDSLPVAPQAHLNLAALKFSTPLFLPPLAARDTAWPALGAAVGLLVCRLATSFRWSGVAYRLFIMEKIAIFT